jgi:preprotein translocase subunit SecY
MPEKRSSIPSLIQNIFGIPDLRKRVLFTLGMLAVYRIGMIIPAPGIDHDLLSNLFDRNSGTIFYLLGRPPVVAFGRFSIFALGIMPYITAYIILQLAAIVVPFLEELSKKGESGREKIMQYTRYLTVVLALFQGLMTAITLERIGGTAGPQIVSNPGWGFRFMVMITLTTGTAIIMWIGEQITERGIGNGICLILFANIVVGLPNAISESWQHFFISHGSIFTVAILIIGMIAVVAAVVFVECGQRKIPVQYGGQAYAGNATHLSLRVNPGSVIPVIFAPFIVAILSPLGAILPSSLAVQLGQGWPIYNLLFAVGIIFFCFLYVNPMEVADNLRKCGGYIPGISPGHETAKYLDSVMSRLTAASALFLVLVCLLPEFLFTGFKVQLIPWIGPALDNFLISKNLDWITTGLGVSFYFGVPSLIIVIGVAMDIIQQIESQSSHPQAGF